MVLIKTDKPLIVELRFSRAFKITEMTQKHQSKKKENELQKKTK